MGRDPREVACILRDRSVTCSGCTLRDLPVGIQCISAICRLSLQTQPQLEGSLQSGKGVGLADRDGASRAGTQGPAGLSKDLYEELDSVRQPGPWLLATDLSFIHPSISPSREEWLLLSSEALAPPPLEGELASEGLELFCGAWEVSGFALDNG